MGYGVGIPVVFMYVAIWLAIRHLWIPAAILIVFAVFGTSLLSLYGRSDRWGR